MIKFNLGITVVFNNYDKNLILIPFILFIKKYYILLFVFYIYTFTEIVNYKTLRKKRKNLNFYGKKMNY